VLRQRLLPSAVAPVDSGFTAGVDGTPAWTPLLRSTSDSSSSVGAGAALVKENRHQYTRKLVSRMARWRLATLVVLP